VDDLASRSHQAIRSPENYVLRDILTFAAGVSLGLGAGILFAPASGQETRNSIADKVQGMGTNVRERFSTEAERAAS